MMYRFGKLGLATGTKDHSCSTEAGAICLFRPMSERFSIYEALISFVQQN